MARWALLLLLFWARSADAQVLIRGSVVEGDSGLPLAAATVQVEGQPIGTVTNRDGTFSLPVPGLPVSLLVRHIGFRSQRIPVDAPPSAPLRVALQPDALLMGELVVSGEDPAIPIMRQVLAAKAAWRDTVSTSYAETYSRFLLFREFDLVEMEETIGASFWRAGRGVREVIRARRTRPERSERFLYARPQAVPNLYDDEAEVDGTRYRTPLHPAALDVYTFRLTARRSLDGRIIHDIAFSPSGISLAGFIGTIAVEDSTFDVLAITARPATGRLGPPPVLERFQRMEQRFARRGGAMLPVYFSADGWVSFGRAGVQYPRARYQQVSGLTFHATEVPLPDSLFRSERRLRDDPAVAAGEWLFDWNPGMIPLSREEQEALAGLRPERRMAAYFRPEGLLAQYAAIPVSEAREEPVEVGVPDPEWFKPWVWYNRVDGWHAGLRPLVPVTRQWAIRPGIAYAEAPDRVRWTAVAERSGNVTTRIGAERFSGIVGTGRHPDRFLTGLAAYAGWDDYFDYYDRARRFGEVGMRAGVAGLGLTLSHETHRSVRKADFYEGWLKKNIQRPNPAIDPGDLASAELRLTLGEPEMTRPSLDAYLEARTEVAARDVLGSDFGFARWQGTVSIRVATLMRRRAVPAHLRMDVVAGGGSSGVPIQRRGVLDVATGPVAGDIAFRSRQDARLVASRWFALFWEHDFGSAISERLGFGETRLGIVVFGAHGTAWHGETTRRDEIGLAWSKPLNLPFRINLATPLSEFAPLVTVEYHGLAERLLGRR